MFTYNYYKSIIELAKERGSNLLMRHDVDLSIKKALEFAEFEANIGINSTYYILTNGEFYNPFCTTNIEKIKMIKDLGHNIGLHYDLTSIKDGDPEAQCLNIQAHRAILEYALRYEIRTISFHNKGNLPNYELLTQLNLSDMVCPDMDQRFKFITDHGGQWTEDPIDVIMNYTNIQMNTHPLWWSESTSEWQSKIHNLGLDLDLDKIIAKTINNISSYRENK